MFALFQTNGKSLCEIAENENPWHVWIEMVPPDAETAELPPFDKQGDILLFIKMYNPYTQKICYCGHMTVPIDGTSVSY